MIEAGLVYIHFDRSSSGFLGCGALVEGPFVVTCRHVWDQAVEAANGGPVLVCFPPPQGLGETVFSEATLADGCADAARPPDLVILEAAVPPASAALSVERALAAETGPAAGLAVLYGRDPATPMLELTIPGTISPRIAPTGLRQFTGGAGAGFWFDRGSSGSPFGLQGGTTLAGILCRSETGAQPGGAAIHEAFLLPASTIHRFLRAHVGRAAGELRGIDPALLPAILDMLGAPSLSLADLRRRLEAYFANVESFGGKLSSEAAPERATLAAASAPAPATDGTARVLAAFDRSRALSAGFEPAAAMAVLDEALAEEARLRRQRVLPLLAEKSRQQRRLRDHEGAIATLVEITTLDPGTPWGWIELGDALRLVARYREALDAIRAGLRAADPAAPRDLLACQYRIGELLALLGDTQGALAAFRALRDIARGLLDAAPDDAARRRDFALSHNMIGDMLRADADTPGALAAYRACLDILQPLAVAEPARADWRQDLSVTHERIGDVLQALGSRSDALAAYRASLALRETLAALDPANPQWQQNLATAHQRVGDLLRLGGDLPAALAEARASLAIAQRVAANDPDDADFQRELSVSHNWVGIILALQGDPDGALAEFDAGLAIIQRLCARDPGRTMWQNDLSASHERIGGILLDRADLPAALAAFQASLAIRRALCTREPGNAAWQRGLAVGHNKVGDTLREQALGTAPGDPARRATLDAALDSFRAGLAIMEPLAARDPDNAEWQRDVSIGHNKIGDILLFQDDRAGALAAYSANLATAQALADRDPDTADWQRDLLVSCVKMASVDPAGPHAWNARALAIATGLAQAGRLAPVDAWMIPDLQARLAALPPDPSPPDPSPPPGPAPPP